MEDLRQQVGSNMMDGGIDELRQGVGNMMVGGVVPNHTNNVHRRSKARVTVHALMSEALPLDEAARLEMKALPNKTPVSVLQELLSRRGTTPKYELVQIEGAIHEPTFRYRVTVADVVAIGTGRSKKEAKHAAAKAVLDKLIGVTTENVEAPLPNSIPDSPNIQEIQSSGYGEEKVVNNPIGSLQEMCMSRHWPPPKYSMEGEEGLPHERLFTIVCSILKYCQVGQGKSKKLAKRQAAHKMWHSLQDTNANRTQGVDEDEIVQRNANVNAHYADLKDSKIATLTTPHSHKVSQFHKNLKSSTGVKLFELQNTCLNDGDVNLVQFLQEIASEQQFEVTYVDIEEKSITGKCQCLVQLSTLPVAVCYGSGMTSKDAEAAAAQNALEYLKIMTKKSDGKLFNSDDQISNLKIGKIDRKLESDISKRNRVTKVRMTNNSTEFKTSANCNIISSTKHNDKKFSNSTGENNRIMDGVKSSVGKFDNVRNTNCSATNPPDIQLTNSKDYCAKKYANELGSKFKNYQSECHKDVSMNQQDNKTRSIENLTPRYCNHATMSGFQRENNRVISSQYSHDEKNSSNVYTAGRKHLDQQSTQTNATPVNFPPLRAPQSIVNVRHPFLTEVRTKHSDIIPTKGSKSKTTLNTTLQSGAKELETGRQTYPNFNTSTLMSPYPRPDPFAQPTLASILFPDTGQFSQSASSYSTNQLNQYETYDSASYHASTSVIPQFSENSLSFPQYDNTTFVQPSHYPAADLANSQYQYQTPGVGQIQDSTMFIQGLQNPITMTDQYAAPNYARAVRTELIHRLRRPQRFTK